MLPGALVMDSFPQAEAAGKTFRLFLPDPSIRLPVGCYVTLCKIAFQHICQQRSLTDELLSITQPLSFCAATAFGAGIIYHDHIVFCQVKLCIIFLYCCLRLAHKPSQHVPFQSSCMSKCFFRPESLPRLQV